MSKASFMEDAIRQARLAAKRDEVPVGAVIIHNNEIIAADGNRTLERKDPTAHAEILVIRSAAQKLGSERLFDCDLHVTLEPCAMCAAAISFARIRRIYYGAPDQKSGAVESGVRFFSNPTCHHAPQVYPGFMESESRLLLKGFFNRKRK